MVFDSDFRECETDFYGLRQRPVLRLCEDCARLWGASVLAVGDEIGSLFGLLGYRTFILTRTCSGKPNSW